MLASVATGYFTELMTLFCIVLVHEMGHVIVAHGFGWTIREVKLLPFGGVAEVEDSGSVPAREEALVAIAGPLQNVWMALAAWGLGQLGIWHAEWTAYVISANAIIALFNLLPILPLDGGKLMHAMLSRSMTYHRTLRWGARISLVLSGCMVLYAVIPWLHAGESGIQLNLLVVGLFLFLTNWTYNRHIPFLFLRFLTTRSAASGRHLVRGAWALPIIVSKRHTVSSALRMFKRDSYHLIVVMEDQGRVLAVLPEQQLVNGYLEDGKPDRAVYDLFM